MFSEVPLKTSLLLQTCLMLCDIIVLLATCKWLRTSVGNAVALTLGSSAHCDCGHELNAMVSRGGWPHLQKLYVWRIPNDGSLCLLSFIKMPKLQHLCLKYSGMEASTLALIGCGDWPELQSLDTSGNVDTERLAHTAAAKWPQLQPVVLQTCQLDVNIAYQLLLADWPVLQWLDTTKNEVSSDAGKEAHA